MKNKTIKKYITLVPLIFLIVCKPFEKNVLVSGIILVFMVLGNSSTGRPLLHLIKSSFNLATELYLSSGSFDKHLITTVSKFLDRFFTIFEMGMGFSLICLRATLKLSSPLKGGSPVSISYITTPKEYISDDFSTLNPFACSGEIY
ncbi:hypothetical protein ES703_45711 [subsurface metagenome]